MKVAGIIVNVFFPGIGSMIIGKAGAGIMQLLMYIIGLVLVFTLIGAIIGYPLMIAAWIWGVVTAATFDETSRL